MGEGAYLENLPELISHAAESSEKVTDEKGLGRAAAPQDHQALGQVLCSRELRSNTSIQRLDLDLSGLHRALCSTDTQHFSNAVKSISCSGRRYKEAWKDLDLAEGLNTIHLDGREIRELPSNNLTELMEPDLCRPKNPPAGYPSAGNHRTNQMLELIRGCASSSTAQNREKLKFYFISCAADYTQSHTITPPTLI